MLANGNLFYLKTPAGQNTAKLYFRKTASSDEMLLVDPDVFGKEDGKPRAINFYEPSWDGSHVAFGISTQGSEDASIRVVETTTGQESKRSYPAVPRFGCFVAAGRPSFRLYAASEVGKGPT